MLIIGLNIVGNDLKLAEFAITVTNKYSLIKIKEVSNLPNRPQLKAEMQMIFSD